jgi:hypothetical protein
MFAEKKGYEPQHKPSVTADNIGTPQDFTMPEITTTYTVGGSITENGEPVTEGTEVILYSTNVNVFKKTTTSSGNYDFSEVIGAVDYTLLVKRSGKPVIKETIGLVNSNTTKDVTIGSETVTGTVDLSDNQAGKTVFVYLVSDTEDVLQTIEAEDVTENAGDYTYTFPVRPGVNYKIAAFCEGYDVHWYDGKADFSSADTTSAGGTANITLTVTQ